MKRDIEKIDEAIYQATIKIRELTWLKEQIERKQELKMIKAT